MVLDETDKEIILFIISGHSSPYSIWSALNKQAQGRGMAYINIKKRVLRLLDTGLLERANLNTDSSTNTRGRKDYKVTMKGLKHLAYVVAHPDDVKLVYEYMDRLGLNKQAFGDPLVNRTASMIKSADRYLKSIRNLVPLPVDPDQFTSLLRSKAELDITLQIIQKAKISRSKRKMLVKYQMVRSMIEGTEHTDVKGHDIELTHITPSKDLVDFEKRQLQQLQQQSSSSSQSKKSKSITPLQKKRR